MRGNIPHKVVSSNPTFQGTRTGVILEQCARLLDTYKVPQRCFVNQQMTMDWYTKLGVDFKGQRGAETHRKQLVEFWKEPTPYVRQFFAYCGMRQWEVVGVELPIGWIGGGVATMMDVFVRDQKTSGAGHDNTDAKSVDSSQRLHHCIEIKTGYNQLWSISCGMLAAPFDAHVDSPENQAHLQLAATTAMARETYPLLAFGESYLIRHHDEFDYTRDVWPCAEWAATKPTTLKRLLCAKGAA